MTVEPEQNHCWYLVQKGVNLVNKELFFPVFNFKLFKFGFKLEENNEKYIFGIFLTFCLCSRSDKAELVQPYSNDLFLCTVPAVLVYK